MAKQYIPQHKHTVISSLEAAIEDAQENLKNPTQEEPTQKNSYTFPGKVWRQLSQAIQNAQADARKSKIKDPDEDKHIHYEAFPQELYDELQQPKHCDFKNELTMLGFMFYMTNEGNITPRHPMVKFTLHF